MRPSSPRRGFTLVEGLVALGLMGVLVSILWQLSSGGARQGAHAEQTAAVVSAGTLVQTALGRDLLESLPLDVLPPEDRLVGEELTRITLPRFERYQEGGPVSLEFRPLVYRWDPDRQALLRDGRPLAAGLLRGVVFRWTTELPRELQVVLKGEGLEGRERVLALQFPAPTGTGGDGFYVPAPWHRDGSALP